VTSDFLTAEERELSERFLAHGRVVQAVEDRAGLDRLRDRVAALAAAHLGLPAPEDSGAFLNAIHAHVDVASLNALRLAVIEGVNAEPWLRPLYFRLARSALFTLVGSELAMQRRVNLSVQLPEDRSSLLPLHADVWSGDSPFEVVVWLPLVDCFATKSMFIASPQANAKWAPRLAEFRSTEELYQAASSDLEFVDIEYGQVMVFDQTLMHGNRVNIEPETRWSMNCRFKGVFTPYADKRIGEFFEPITLKPASRIGLDYQAPGGFAP
jgi:sporadic carbohydrate cluster 2OG-Fe(II) oxygenase